MMSSVNTAISALVLAFDTIVMILTVAKTCYWVWQARKVGVRNTLISIVLRDGASSQSPLHDVYHFLKL